jgi:NAD(P)-dependent dehydrogenase (short-subunit alcohol dehydrogenase family)
MNTVLITGANRGIGLELVRQYAADNFKIVACCRDPDDATELLALAQVHDITIETLDVSDFNAIDTLASNWPHGPIDILINNAGIFGPKAQAENDWRQSFGHMDYDIWAAVLRTNLMAPLKIAEAFTSQVAASEIKKIVTISSAVSSIAETETGLYAYRTSKAAVNMAMATLANELRGQRITVGVFCPGWVRTRMGGDGASVTPRQSIEGLRQRIDELSLEQTPRLTRYNGDIIPW